jgi:hypothetical protein
MALRAKVKVASITDYGSSKGVKMHPVTSPGHNDVNKSWSKWTPEGSFEMRITNPEAFNQFQVDRDYFVEFTPADPPPPPAS